MITSIQVSASYLIHIWSITSSFDPSSNLISDQMMDHQLLDAASMITFLVTTGLTQEQIFHSEEGSTAWNMKKLGETIDADFDSDSIWKMLFCSYVMFLLRDQWLLERLSKAMGAALVGNNFSPIPSNFSFHIKKKKWLVAAWNLKSIKTWLTFDIKTLLTLKAC